MTQRIAAACFVIAIASPAVAGQQPAVPAGTGIRTVEIRGLDGKWMPFEEDVTTPAGRDVFGFDLEGRRVLQARIEPGQPNEFQRFDATEQRIDSNTMRRDITESFRDVNNRWQFTSTRTIVSRQLGPSDRIDEDTLLRPDLNGRLTVAERTIARRSVANGREEVVVETFAPNAWEYGYDGALVLSHRIRATTTPAADGGATTIEEVESPNPAAPGDPVRVTRRTVITASRLGDHLQIAREVFERDVNGRMVQVLRETEHSAAP